MRTIFFFLQLSETKQRVLQLTEHLEQEREAARQASEAGARASKESCDALAAKEAEVMTEAGLKSTLAD